MKKNIKENSKYFEIAPPNGLINLNFREIWQYKDLLSILIWRNIKVRYKQTIIGATWAVLLPLFTMIIFTIIFSRIAKIPSDNVPYPIFVYLGLIYWNYFSSALSGANSSLIEGQSIIKKIYFPRLIIPLATTITPLIDFLLAFIILFGLMAYLHYLPHFIGVLFVPFLLLITFCCATGLGLLAASMNVKYRDVQYALSFFIQVLFYATPIIYPLSIVPERYRWLVYFNPMAGVITGAKSSLFGSQPIDWRFLGISLGISLILLILGLIYFRKSEQFFADIL